MIVSQSVRSKLALQKLRPMTDIDQNCLITPFTRNNVRLGFHAILVVLVTAFLFSGCKQKESVDDEAGEPEETEKVAALRKKVLAIHDEVMPLMTDIYQHKNKMKERLQSESTLTSEEKKRFETVLIELDSADRGMRVWMRQFSDVTTTGIPEEEAISKLNLELTKITKVKEDMVASVEAAKALDK
jgi:hypothetical protein